MELLMNPWFMLILSLAISAWFIWRVRVLWSRRTATHRVPARILTIHDREDWANPATVIFNLHGREHRTEVKVVNGRVGATITVLVDPDRPDFAFTRHEPPTRVGTGVVGVLLLVLWGLTWYAGEVSQGRSIPWLDGVIEESVVVGEAGWAAFSGLVLLVGALSLGGVLFWQGWRKYRRYRAAAMLVGVALLLFCGLMVMEFLGETESFAHRAMVTGVISTGLGGITLFLAQGAASTWRANKRIFAVVLATLALVTAVIAVGALVAQAG